MELGPGNPPPAALADDPEATIEGGTAQIGAAGWVSLELQGLKDELGDPVNGPAFVLLNVGDGDGDADRDFLFSGLVEVTDGSAAAKLAAAVPPDTSVEDLLITVVLDSGEAAEPLLDGTDTILAVPGFETEHEFALEGKVSALEGTCPDVTFAVDGHTVAANADTEYEQGSCEDLTDGAQVEVKGVVLEDNTYLVQKVEFPEVEAGGEDEDGDGVPDEEDSCDGSDSSPTVVINGCDTGVANVAVEDGCTLSDLINDECLEGAAQPGKLASCVAHLASELKKDGVITGAQQGALQSCAATTLNRRR